MRKVLLLIGIFLVATSLSAYAHPPSKIVITYDKATSTIFSVINHGSFFKKKHRISKVEVFVDGEIVKTELLGSQFNKKEQRLSTVVENIKQGDEISVVAYCNLFGKREASIKVEE